MPSASSIEMANAFVRIGTKDDTKSGLASIAGKLRGFGRGLRQVGHEFVKIGAFMLGPIALAVKQAYTLGEELRKGSRDTALSITQLGQMQGLSPEQAEAAALLSRMFDRVAVSVRRLYGAIAAALLPTLNKYLPVVIGVIEAAIKWIDANRQLIPQIAIWGAVLIAAGTAIIILAGAVTALGGALIALDIIMTATTAIAAAMAATFAFIFGGEVVAAIALIGVWIVTLNQLGVEMDSLFLGSSLAARGLGAAWSTLAMEAVESFGIIKDALIAGDIESAFKAVTLGLEIIWQGFRTGIQKGWQDTINAIIAIWNGLIDQLAGALKSSTIAQLFQTLAPETLGRLTGGLESAKMTPFGLVGSEEQKFDALMQEQADLKAKARQAAKNAISGLNAPGANVNALLSPEAKGTFGSSALRGQLMKSDKVSEKMLKTQEAIAEYTKKTAENTADKPTFTK